jgi:hypothetical protein
VGGVVLLRRNKHLKDDFEFIKRVGEREDIIKGI